MLREVILREEVMDEISWNLTNNRLYSSKSAYKAQFFGAIWSPVRASLGELQIANPKSTYSDPSKRVLEAEKGHAVQMRQKRGRLLARKHRVYPNHPIILKCSNIIMQNRLFKVLNHT
jgi:hypothetical protein